MLATVPMLKNIQTLALITGAGCIAAGIAATHSATAQTNGDKPVIVSHMNQSQINSGRTRFNELFEAGKFLFTAKFNRLDGFGRPGATGNGTPTARVPGSAPMMHRVSGMDANSCFGCHNEPESGGSGDFVANVFVLGQLSNPVQNSIEAEFSNERNTLGMHGAGAIEALAIEMSNELIAIRAAAMQQAINSGQPVVAQLVAKEVEFGSIVAYPNGTFNTSGIEGVDADLIIKPFHQKGVVNSIRVFTNNAFNHHHGMQSVERFGMSQTGTADFDQDGVVDELSAGDITATAIYQAGLSIPTQVIPSSGQLRSKVFRGKQLFLSSGCGTCHRPSMVLNSRYFQEPNPYNPAGNLRLQDVPAPFRFDMTTMGQGNRLERLPNGKALVRAFTDLKRHIISDEQDSFFSNEQLVQGGVATNSFLTRKLWDCGSSAPYGHRGDCSSIGEAIFHHAGEARSSREAYIALSDADKNCVIEFLKSLKVVVVRGRDDR